MEKHIDLHIHTIYSDGLCGAARLLEIVRRENLAAFSITDHDTIDGYLEVYKLLDKFDPELVPGVEISARVDDDELHILGYLFDPSDKKLNYALGNFQRKREKRGQLIVEKLNKLGLDLSFKTVMEKVTGTVIGRPHIAEALYKSRMTGSYQEAFDKYIGNSGPAYVPKTAMPPAEAIGLIHQAGGVAMLAHPLIGDMIRYLDMLLALGLDGIEVYHYSHNRENIAFLNKIVDKYGLVAGGGSDFHGRSGQNCTVGSMKVPYDILDNLKYKLLQRRGIN
ncbi:MAG: PHP domain-containing protein [candidate division Zixibacteria bacterium]|nr:PHP domain-containing protein [candidate division Zixibacteria bacterium]